MIRRPPLFSTLVAIVALAASAGALHAQDTDACWIRGGTFAEAMERVSPRQAVALPLGDAEGTLCYGRPSARGRTVMGELVPFGRAWRTGADEATSLHLPFPAAVGDVELAPGSYSIFTIPGEESWEVVLSGAWERWGIPVDAEVRSEVVGRVRAEASSTDAMVETFTIRFEPSGERAGRIVMEWERTRVAVPIRRLDG